MDVSVCIGFHPVRFPRIPFLFTEDTVICDCSVGLHIESAHMHPFGVVNVEDGLVRREADTVGSIEVIDEKGQCVTIRGRGGRHLESRVPSLIQRRKLRLSRMEDR